MKQRKNFFKIYCVLTLNPQTFLHSTRNVMDITNKAKIIRTVWD